MIELGRWRMRWDGSNNWVVEREATDKDGNLKRDKDGEQKYCDQKWHGRYMQGALGCLARCLEQDAFFEEDPTTLEQLNALVTRTRESLDKAFMDKFKEEKELIRQYEMNKETA